MKKRVLALLLCLAMLLAAVPAAQAAGVPFTDTPQSAWYYSAVEFCYENALFSGVSETRFGPDVQMSRAMLVAVLHRSSGKPSASGQASFLDVRPGAWYDDAVQWAADCGVVYGENTAQGLAYAPDRSITREQMVAILFRYANLQGDDDQRPQHPGPVPRSQPRLELRAGRLPLGCRHRHRLRHEPNDPEPHWDRHPQPGRLHPDALFKPLR